MSEIHDNIIKSYIVDLENNRIVFNTVYYCNNITEKTSIEFNNVMGHSFSNEMNGSVIFDIDTYGNETLIQNKNYGWPFSYKDENELMIKLNKNNQKYYIINSSYGLEGWILAEEMKINRKEIK